MCLNENAVLREFYHPVVRKQKFSNTAKLPAPKLVFVPLHPFRHEYLEMTEKVISQVKTTVMGFSGKVHSCGIRKAICRAIYLSTGISVQPRPFGHAIRMFHERLAGQVLVASPLGKRLRGRSRSRWHNYIFFYLACARLGCGVSRTIIDCGKVCISSPRSASVPVTLPRRN